jgi:hypothetical protein
VNSFFQFNLETGIKRDIGVAWDNLQLLATFGGCLIRSSRKELSWSVGPDVAQISILLDQQFERSVGNNHYYKEG